MSGNFFLDTNVVVYLLSEDPQKAETAEKLLSEKAIISSQVVNEFFNVCVRKLKLSRTEAGENAEALMRSCQVIPVTAATVKKALAVGLRYEFSHWDSLIIAAALEASSNILFSEDMQHEQTINGKLQIINPFV